MITNRMEGLNPQQIKMPKPGDYDLGSLESRAAARVLLDAADQQNRFRVVVEHMGRPQDQATAQAKFAGKAVENMGEPVTLETSTCLRYRCADITDPGKSLIVEVINLNGAHPTEMQSEQIERWIRKVPIDGQRHNFAEHGP